MKENKDRQLQFELSDFYLNVIKPIHHEAYQMIDFEGYWRSWFTCQCGRELIANQHFCDGCGARIDWNIFDYEDYRY